MPTGQLRRVLVCSHCGVAPPLASDDARCRCCPLPLEVRARAADAAPVWVCFRGGSAARRAELEAERARTAPAPVAPASFVDRHFETLFLFGIAVVMGVALLLGILSRLR